MSHSNLLAQAGKLGGAILCPESQCCSRGPRCKTGHTVVFGKFHPDAQVDDVFGYSKPGKIDVYAKPMSTAAVSWRAPGVFFFMVKPLA